MPRPRKTALPKRLYLPLEPRTLYLADLAARASGQSVAKIVESAVNRAFDSLYLDNPEMLEGPKYFDHVGQEVGQEDALKPSFSVASQAENLWHSSEFVRLLRLANSEVYWLVSEPERRILQLIQADEQYCSLASGKPVFDIGAVERDWQKIKAVAGVHTTQEED